jgi:LPXTG-motif cell wall-anchored protein
LLGLWNAHGSRKPFEPDPAKINIFIWGNLKGETSMKQFKRIMAFALALVLTLAMSITVFAEDPSEGEEPEVTLTSSSITVMGLTDREQSHVALYKAITINEDGSKWEAEDWISSSVTDTNGVVTNKSDDQIKEILKNLVDETNHTVQNTDPDKTIDTTAGEDRKYETSVKFTGLERGAYLIVITSENVTYSELFAVTYKYDDTTGLMGYYDATVYAKSTTSNISKKGEDDFVYNGEPIDFQITVTIPYNATEFTVYDKSENLKNFQLTEITVNGEPDSKNLTLAEDPTDSSIHSVNLNAYVKQEAYYGATVVIKYTAEVDGVDGYSNGAYTNINGTQSSSSTVTATSGKITLTKTNEDSSKKLAGAEYVVSKLDDNGNTVYATFGAEKEENGTNVYQFVKWENSKPSTGVVTGSEGALQVTGLDEGTYTFEEIKAPAGYSLAGFVTKDTSGNTLALSKENDSLNASQSDTQLVKLPSTGGIGTTIFTVAGCLIMIAAAGMYFASRRKSAK